MVYNFFLVSLLFSDYTKLKTCACSVSFFFAASCSSYSGICNFELFAFCVRHTHTHTHQLNVRLIFFFDRNLNKLSIYAYARVCLFLYMKICFYMKSHALRIEIDADYAKYNICRVHFVLLARIVRAFISICLGRRKIYILLKNWIYSRARKRNAHA